MNKNIIDRTKLLQQIDSLKINQENLRKEQQRTRTNIHRLKKLIFEMDNLDLFEDG